MIRKLDGIGIIAAPTFRSRAYLQMLERLELRPDVVVHLSAPEDTWTGDDHVELALNPQSPPFIFQPGRTARATAAANDWNTLELDGKDINAPAAVTAIASLRSSVLVYSGMPKALLRQPLLDTGKRFLHVHGGYVPAYRGATGFYYGLLEQGKLGVSAIWLDEGVDTGPIIARDWYSPINGIDIDLIMDPVIRADMLGHILQYYLDFGAFPSTPQSGPSENFFIIHPVLKHLALRRAGLVFDSTVKHAENQS